MTIYSLSRDVTLSHVTSPQYYGKFAIHMTDWENYKTQLEYENTLTIRRYVFEVFNFYSSLVYIGFFKGKLVLLISRLNWSNFLTFFIIIALH